MIDSDNSEYEYEYEVAIVGSVLICSEELIEEGVS
jgi:hypothetical protein